MTTFLFLRVTHDLSCESGDARRAALRPSVLIPVPVHSHLRGLARPRYQDRRVTPPDLRPTSSVTIDVHGSLDRAKDVSSFAGPLVGRSREECVRLAHADDVPLLILPEDTGCHRCVRLPGNEPPADDTDRPRLALLRQPAKADGILQTRVPSTVATEHVSGLLHLVYPHRFPAHAAHTFSPWLGTMCFGGHCKRLHRHYPAGTFGEQDTFSTALERVSALANLRLGLTTQANQCGSVCEAFRGS